MLYSLFFVGKEKEMFIIQSGEYNLTIAPPPLREKKSAKGREFKVYKEREGNKKGKDGKERKRGRKGEKKWKKEKIKEKGSKNQLKNFACGTDLKFTKGENSTTNFFGGKRNQT